MNERLDHEVDRNFDAFEQMLPRLLPEHEGEFALMRDGKIIDFLPDEMAALATGRHRFDDGVYSIQQVSQRPADLGFFSHAIDPRLAG